MSYLPIPPRVWSRVQNECSVNTSSSNLVFEPLTGQYVTQEEYNRLKQIQIKGNILQYKNNSSNLTKKQKYSKIAKGQWTNRTKTWATQSLTYSNPNTTSLQRVNASTLAATANTPFVTNVYSIVPSPFNCPVASIADIPDGGNLVATVTVNPCTNEIIKTTTITNCSLSTDCDVPGPPIALCWNPRLPTYYPKQNLTNNNSTDKWPFNYKGLVSALRPFSPVLSASSDNCSTIILSWTYQNNVCLPIDSFNIYLNGNLFKNISVNTNSYIFNETYGLYNIYVTSLSNSIESEPSNVVLIVINQKYILIGDSYIKVTEYFNFGSKGIVIETTLDPTSSINYGQLIFKLCENLNVNVLMVGGGGGGGSSYYYSSILNLGAGGGGGGINYLQNLNVPLNNDITMIIGKGGLGGNLNINNGIGLDGYQTSVSYQNYYYEASFGEGGCGGNNTLFGGGNGGAASQLINVGYGGGGGGGGSSSSLTNIINPGQGGLAWSNGNPGTQGYYGSQVIIDASGGSSTTYSFYIPFLGYNIDVGGGGGGSGLPYGGNAGNGIGGTGGGNNSVNGESASNYGGGGGGGSFDLGPSSGYGGNGGNGVIIIWW